jgi:hypothetical protein
MGWAEEQEGVIKNIQCVGGGFCGTEGRWEVEVEKCEDERTEKFYNIIQDMSKAGFTQGQIDDRLRKEGCTFDDMFFLVHDYGGPEIKEENYNKKEYERGIANGLSKEDAMQHARDVWSSHQVTLRERRMRK